MSPAVNCSLMYSSKALRIRLRVESLGSTLPDSMRAISD